MGLYWRIPVVACILLASYCVALNKDFSYTSDRDHVGPITDQGYIIDLDVICPKHEDESGVILLKSDVPTYAIALCKNGNKNFTRMDKATQRLIIDYKAGDFDRSYCAFYKRHGMETYVVEIHGGWGEVGQEVMTHRLRRTVSCTLSDHAESDRKNAVSIGDYVIGPNGVPHFTNELVDYRVDMEVVNIYNQAIDGRSSNLGRLIRLIAKLPDQPHYVIKPLTCVAANSAAKSYEIIRAGCGDGLVFERHRGFMFDNRTRVSKSPFFYAFKLPGADDLYFRCIFVICVGYCPGDSCQNERKKREATSADIEKLPKVPANTGFVIIQHSAELPLDSKMPKSLLGFPRIYPHPADSSVSTGDDPEWKYIIIILALSVVLVVVLTILLTICYRSRRRTLFYLVEKTQKSQLDKGKQEKF